jgi:restriction system protein
MDTNLFTAIILPLWPLWLGLGILVTLKVITELVWPVMRRERVYRRQAQWLTGREQINFLKTISPQDFEHFTARLYARLGYHVQVVGGSHDGGIDLVADKDGRRHYIQCKRYSTRQVPVGAVRDFYGAMADKAASGKGFFITTSTFTLEAEKFAQGKPIELIDGLKLAEYVSLAKMFRGR